MKLYEINKAVEDLLNQLDIDYETGEIGGNYDEIMEQVNALDMERSAILQYLAKVVINVRAEAAALKEEETRLKERRDALTKKEDRLIGILDRECGGEKTDLGIAVFSYRKTSRVEVTDEEKAIRWLKRNKYTDCYRIPAPQVSKTDVKRLIGRGEKVPGCSVVEGYSCLLK